MSVHLPEADKVLLLLKSLLGCEVPFTDAGQAEPLDSGFGCICNDDDGKPVAAFTADARAGAFLGGRLMMMPVGPLEEAAQSGELDEVLIEALSEVFNNLTVPMNAVEENPHMASTPAIKLDELKGQEAASWLGGAKRLELQGDVLGGTGRLTVLVPA